MGVEWVERSRGRRSKTWSALRWASPRKGTCTNCSSAIRWPAGSRPWSRAPDRAGGQDLLRIPGPRSPPPARRLARLGRPGEPPLRRARDRDADRRSGRLLCRRARGSPGAVAGLRHNAIYIVLLAVNNPSLMDRSAIYIPDPEVLPHRVRYTGFFSPQMVRPGASSLIAEVTCRPGDATDAMGGEGILERTVRLGPHGDFACRRPDCQRRPPRRICLSGLRSGICPESRTMAPVLRLDRRPSAGPFCPVRLHQLGRVPAAGPGPGRAAEP